MENPSDAADLISWELRPGGMLVQKRETEGDGASVSAGPLIKVKVSHGLLFHNVTVPAQASFGDLKKLLSQETGLQPNEQRLLFRGKEKDDIEYLHVAGVKDKAKLILVEDPASRERKMEQMKNNERIERACKAVAAVRAEVDVLAQQLSAIEGTIQNGIKVPVTDLDGLTEMLMRQLLKLDAIEADGEEKVQRRLQVKRVQKYVEILDALRSRNAIPHPAASTSELGVTTKWERFGNGVGSLSAPPPSASPPVNTDWERFD